MKPQITLKNLILLTLSLGLTGCYDLYSIAPTEVPKLNNTYTVQVGSTTSSSYNYSTKQTSYTSTPIYSHSVRHVRRANGTNLHVTGSPPVIITTNRGKFTFTHPTIASIEGDSLIISGGNRPNTRFLLSDIKKVQIKIYNRGKTTLVYTAVALLPLLILIPIL